MELGIINKSLPYLSQNKKPKKKIISGIAVYIGITNTRNKCLNLSREIKYKITVISHKNNHLLVLRILTQQKGMRACKKYIGSHKSFCDTQNVFFQSLRNRKPRIKYQPFLVQHYRNKMTCLAASTMFFVNGSLDLARSFSCAMIL